MPLLTAMLDDADDSVRGQAFKPLQGMIGTEPKQLLAAAGKIMRTRNDNLHPAAAATIRKLGPTMMPEILAMLRSDEAKSDDGAALRLVCLQTLTMSGPAAKQAVDDLTKALRDPSSKVRLTAARALGNLGPDAKNAADSLAVLEKDSDTSVRSIAKAGALVQIRSQPGAGDFEVQGVLTADDPFDSVRPNCHYVVHGFPMKAGRTYVIDLISPWDNFLRLEDADGRQLAFDDDSGGNLNARITHQATQDGWYRIIVTSFAPNATGNYTLKVR